MLKESANITKIDLFDLIIDQSLTSLFMIYECGRYILHNQNILKARSKCVKMSGPV